MQLKDALYSNNVNNYPLSDQLTFCSFSLTTPDFLFLEEWWYLADLTRNTKASTLDIHIVQTVTSKNEAHNLFECELFRETRPYSALSRRYTVLNKVVNSFKAERSLWIIVKISKLLRLTTKLSNRTETVTFRYVSSNSQIWFISSRMIAVQLIIEYINNPNNLPSTEDPPQWKG